MNLMNRLTAGSDADAGQTMRPRPTYPVSPYGNAEQTGTQPAELASIGGTLRLTLATNKEQTMNSSIHTEATAGALKSGNGHKVDTYLIPFNQMEISKWNRSCGIPADDQYVQALAEDIKRNGLLHAITLVKTVDGAGYRIVAGANRVAAFKALRGADAGLMQSEFKVRDDLNEDSDKCLAVSIAENHHRRASSVWETACYVDRLTKELGVDQGKLARMLGLDRPKVNRLQKLAECFGQLPESWRKDLNTSPTSDTTGVVVSFSHWYEVAGLIKDDPLTPDILDVLTCAHDEQWPTRQLRRALKKALHETPDADATEETAGRDATEAGASNVPAAKSNPVELLKTAVRYIRMAGGFFGVDQAADAAELVKHADAVEVIAGKLETLRSSAKQAKADAEKAAKAAEKKAEVEARRVAKDAEKHAKAEARKVAAEAARAEKAKQVAANKAAKLEQRAAKVASEAEQAKAQAAEQAARAEKAKVPGKAA